MLAVALLVCYLLGSIPSAFLLVSKVKRVDIRTVGSGNVGASNALRTAGLWAGLTVLLIDGLKGFIAVTLIAPWLMGDPTPATRLGCGLAAVIGHDFPVFLKFRGGKGVATTIGVLLGAMPGIATVGLAVWAVVFSIWRYVSVGSIALATMIPILQLLAHQTLAQVLLGAVLALLMVVRHRRNIGRLLQGTEPRLSFPPQG